MTLNAYRNVADLPESDRQSIEHLVGKPLESHQEVFVMVYTPGTALDENARSEARQHLIKNINELHADLQQRGVTSDEVDTAIDEAMDQIRHRTK